MRDKSLFDRDFDLGVPQYLLGALIVCVLIGVLVAGATSTAAFGAYNPSWDGSRQLRTTAAGTGAETVIATETSAYTTVQPNATTAVILAPSSRYDREAVRNVRSFVTNGGTLVVAGDFGTPANVLLRNLGIQMRISGHLVRDERHYWRGPSLPVATNVNESAPGEFSQLTLNHGSVLTHTKNATIWVNTSGYAYLDTNRNAKLDSNESLSRRPVVAVEHLGSGRVIVVSDPSIFINSMLARDGNQAFARTLFANQTTALFDYSHAGGVPPLAAAVLTIRDTPILQVGLLGVLLLVVGMGVRRPVISTFIEAVRDRDALSTTPSLTREEVTTLVAQEHPEWDEERIERVVDGVIEEDDTN